MRFFLNFVLFFMAIHNSYAEDIISREDARSVLNMHQSAWNAQVMASTKAGLSSSHETYGGTLKQVIKGSDWEMSIYPVYGGIVSVPNAIEIKVSYKKNSAIFKLSSPESEAICAKAFGQLKTEFSFLCAYAKTNDELQYTFLISKPGSRSDIDIFNKKGVYTFDQKKMENLATIASKNLILKYWAQLDAWTENRTASKEELVTIAVKELPAICSKLVTSYALVSGKSLDGSREDREEWDFNSDFCVKATIHRRFPQPEFENPKILDMVCHKQRAYEFNYNLCKRAGVLP